MATEENDMWDELNIGESNRTPEAWLSCTGHWLWDRSASGVVDAGMDVHGTDVATQMINHAKASVKGTFQVANMVDHKPQGTFDAVFIIFSQLGLTYAEFYGAVERLAHTLRPDGLLVIGQAPAEQVVPPQDDAWDATQSYVEGHNLPFWGQPFPTLMFSLYGHKKLLESMGVTALYDEVNTFQPDDANCCPEDQRYIIARRNGSDPVKQLMPVQKAKV